MTMAGSTNSRAAYKQAWFAANATRLRPGRKAYATHRRNVFPWQKLLEGAKTRAKAKGLPFDLTAEWFEARYNGHCELTGIKFRVAKQRGPQPFSHSVDRVIPEKGYTKDNCRLVIWAVNALRCTMTDEQMFDVAAQLVAAREKRQTGVAT